MTDSEKRGDEAAIEAAHALGGPEVSGAMTDGLVGAGRVLGGREHAGLDDPYGIGEEGGENARHARRGKVVKGCELVVGTVVGAYEVFDVAVPVGGRVVVSAQVGHTHSHTQAKVQWSDTPHEI